MGPKTKISFIPFFWNFYLEIKRKIQTIRNSKSDIFITYFPKLIIE